MDIDHVSTDDTQQKSLASITASEDTQLTIRCLPSDIFKLDPKNEKNIETLNSFTRTFTCFPKLPLEIRITIWKFCFPQNRPNIWRAVNLSGPQSSNHVAGTLRDLATLRINRESRYETLKHYCIILRKDVLPKKKSNNKKKTKPAFIANPEIDMMRFDQLSILRNPHSIKILMAQVSARYPKFTSKITELQLVCEVRLLGKTTAFGREELLMFPNLKAIYLVTAARRENRKDKTVKELFVQLKASYDSFLEENRLKFNRKIAPICITKIAYYGRTAKPHPAIRTAW